ncbi:Neutral ceramidase [Nymphon striatum]|nr:Neutral ceramidase [Nymphon striatum]
MPLLVIVLTLSITWLANAVPIDQKYSQNDIYDVGVGRADVTGPAAQVNMMGYADPAQNTAGIHFRLYSRAFIIGQGDSRVIFVSVDTAMMSQILSLEVVKRLKAKFGNIYTEKNVCFSGTHTHSAPGGFLQYMLYVVTALGFKKDSFDALANGMVLSIERAHRNIQMARIYHSKGELLNANINRSPTSYLLNPPDERKMYKYDVDKEMFLLKFIDLNDKPIGMLNWFPVHCTSMNKTNRLISGDNKGLASLLFEQYMEESSLFGNSSFVAAFSQANEGDVTPNIMGPRCQYTGLPCDLLTSTCDGNSASCMASGPGKDMFESTKIIAERQFEKAKELFNLNGTKLEGSIRFSHRYVDMTNQTVYSKITKKTSKTCGPAMGYSFAAGTIDGPSVGLFHQGTTKHNSALDLISGWLLESPSEEQSLCHQPKPILLDTGETNDPYAWQPKIVGIQLLNIGQLIIAAVPGEFTTMSGRRLKNSIKEAIGQSNVANSSKYNVVIAGLANTYSSYIATFEEYQAQRYEAASTIYGPHTLEAYQKLYSQLTKEIFKNETLDDGPHPPDLLNISSAFAMPFDTITYDESPSGKKFGDILEDESTVEVVFASANPDNFPMLEKTFFTVELFDIITSTWHVVATDADWQTKFHWSRNCGKRCSTVLIEWNVPKDVRTGRYRIQHFGFSKNKSGLITPFTGKSSTFTVTMKNSILHMINLLIRG